MKAHIDNLSENYPREIVHFYVQVSGQKCYFVMQILGQTFCNNVTNAAGHFLHTVAFHENL